jgi:putative acyl-CoA dehydrogenase
MWPRLWSAWAGTGTSKKAPLNSIWEGSGNVIALDVLRAIAKDPESLDRVLAEIRQAREPRLERFLENLNRAPDEAGARRLAEALALAFEASLLLRHSPSPIADAFVASRLEGVEGHVFGTLPPEIDVNAVVALCDRTL